MVFMKTGPKICTQSLFLSFVVNEISCNKVTVPEGMAGVNI